MFIFSEINQAWQGDAAVKQILVFPTQLLKDEFEKTFAERVEEDGIEKASDSNAGAIYKLRAVLQSNGKYVAIIRCGNSGELLWEGVTVYKHSQSALIIAAKADRAFPFMGFVGMTDSSEEPIMQTFGFGRSETVREGLYKWISEFRRGGVNANNALRTFNHQEGNFDVLFVDASNTLIGTLRPDVDGNNGLAGIPLTNLYTFPWKANEGSKLAQYRTQFEFEPIYINENIAYRKVDTLVYLLKELNGLTDLSVTSGAAATNTTATVKVMTACGEDLFDSYADEFADATAFVLTNKTTGGVISVTSVVKNVGLKSWVITIPTSSNANYPSASGVYTVAVASPSVLAGLDIEGFEGTVALDVTRPA